jgi:hypothetical protein
MVVVFALSFLTAWGLARLMGGITTTNPAQSNVP